jgi:hypothetical protein
VPVVRVEEVELEVLRRLVPDSPSSQASARSWASSGIEEESGINPAW